MTNAELIAEAHSLRGTADPHVWAMTTKLASALERTERERDEAVAREAVLRKLSERMRRPWRGRQCCGN